MTAVHLAEPGGMPKGNASAGEPFLDPLVARLSAQHGLDPQTVRSYAHQVLASFAGARVQAFVPVLVEKQLRHICRTSSPSASGAPSRRAP